MSHRAARPGRVAAAVPAASPERSVRFCCGLRLSPRGSRWTVSVRPAARLCRVAVACGPTLSNRRSPRFADARRDRTAGLARRASRSSRVGSRPIPRRPATSSGRCSTTPGAAVGSSTARPRDGRLGAGDPGRRRRDHGGRHRQLPRRSIVFNTGMVLHGWVGLLEAGFDGYDDAADRAARFLIGHLRPDGTWDLGSSTRVCRTSTTRASRGRCCATRAMPATTPSRPPLDGSSTGCVAPAP